MLSVWLRAVDNGAEIRGERNGDPLERNEPRDPNRLSGERLSVILHVQGHLVSVLGLCVAGHGLRCAQLVVLSSAHHRFSTEASRGCLVYRRRSTLQNQRYAGEDGVQEGAHPGVPQLNRRQVSVSHSASQWGLTL